MLVKEMIEYLSQFNPEAKVYSLIEHTPFSRRFAFGSSEGCTMQNCGEVFIYVKDEATDEKPQKDKGQTGQLRDRAVEWLEKR